MSPMSPPDRTIARLTEVRQMFKSGEAKQLREAAGLSQAEFARAVRVSRSAVCNWEAGHRSMRTEHALRAWSILSRLRAVGF